MKSFITACLLTLLASTTQCTVLHRPPQQYRPNECLVPGFMTPADQTGVGPTQMDIRLDLQTVIQYLYAGIDPKTGQRREPLGECDKHHARLGNELTIPDQYECCHGSVGWSDEIICRVYSIPLGSTPNCTADSFNANVITVDHTLQPSREPRPQATHLLGWQLPANPDSSSQWADADYASPSWHEPGYASINPATGDKRNSIGPCEIDPPFIRDEDECCNITTFIEDIQLCRVYEHTRLGDPSLPAMDYDGDEETNFEAHDEKFPSPAKPSR